MTSLTAYKQILKVMENEIQTTYPKLIHGLKYVDATTLAGKLLMPSTSTAERVLVVKYDADAEEKTFFAGTTLGTRPVNHAKAVPFVIEAAGGAFAGCALGLGSSGTLETKVVFPLLGSEPFPTVPDAVVRWMAGQAIRSGALVEAVVQFTSLCDAGMPLKKAAAICKKGFAPYRHLLHCTSAWSTLFV